MCDSIYIYSISAAGMKVSCPAVNVKAEPDWLALSFD